MYPQSMSQSFSKNKRKYQMFSIENCRFLQLEKSLHIAKARDARRTKATACILFLQILSESFVKMTFQAIFQVHYKRWTSYN